METGPPVAVLLPVYNGQATIEETVKSLLAQTYEEFRIIVCIDGTHDDSAEIVRSFEDSRITLIENESNLGLGSTLNRIIYSLKWTPKYFAMAEQDDYYYPIRLEREVSFLDAHEHVGMTSGIAEFWDGNRVTARFPGILDFGGQYPSGEEMFLLNYINQIKVVNTCAMIRRSVHVENGLYFSRHYPSVSVDWSYVLRFSLVSTIRGINEIFVRMNRLADMRSVTSDSGKRDKAARELLNCFRYEKREIVTEDIYYQAGVNQTIMELGTKSGGDLVFSLLKHIALAPTEARYYSYLIKRLRAKWL